jgi:hypothetical protein
LCRVRTLSDRRDDRVGGFSDCVHFLLRNHLDPLAVDFQQDRPDQLELA